MYKMSVIVCVDDSDGATVRKGDYSTRTEDWDPKSKKKGPNWGGPSIALFDLIIVIIRLIQNSGSKHTSILDRIIFCNVKEIYNFFQIIIQSNEMCIYNFFQIIWSREMCIYFIKLLSPVFKMYEFGNPWTCSNYVHFKFDSLMKIIIIRAKLVDLE